MKNLTKAEDQVMRILWRLGKGFVKDILEQFPEPKPAYNTVSTIVRILEKKGFVSHKVYGKTHEYYPIVSQDAYKQHFLQTFVKNYFENSFQEMVSFFAQDRNLSASELEEIMELLQEELKKQREGRDE